MEDLPTQDINLIRDRTRECLESMKKALQNEPPKVVILLGKIGAGKSSLLEYLSSAHGHSSSGESSVTNEFQIEKMSIEGSEYYVVDTPGFDTGNEAEVFHEIVRAVDRVRSHAAHIVGVLLVTPINQPRSDSLDRKLLGFVRAFCGEKYMSQITLVTTRWEAYAEEDKWQYNQKLKGLLDNIGSMKHYGHGREYKQGQADSDFALLRWNKDIDEMKACAKDMLHHHYGNASSLQPQIVGELETGISPESTEAGRFLGLERTSTPSSTDFSTAASVSDFVATEKENFEGSMRDVSEEKEPFKDESPDQVPPSKDPPQENLPNDLPKGAPPQDKHSESSTSSKGVPKQETQPQSNTSESKDSGKYTLGDALDDLSEKARNVDWFSVGKYCVNLVKDGCEIYQFIKKNQSQPSSSSPSFSTRQHYSGPLKPHISVADAFAAKGWDNSFENRARVGKEMGIPGNPGDVDFNALLRDATHRQ